MHVIRVYRLCGHVCVVGPKIPWFDTKNPCFESMGGWKLPTSGFLRTFGARVRRYLGSPSVCGLDSQRSKVLKALGPRTLFTPQPPNKDIRTHMLASRHVPGIETS